MKHKLYLDATGVTRGYYVYLHKVRATGEVFYVGKGNGRRAWDINQRNPDWIAKVASLTDGWEVEIVQDDLSEIEAFDLERKLVEQYGGCASSGGTLSNLIPGGEDPAAIRIGIPLDDGGWFVAYCGARRFNEFPRDEEEAIAKKLSELLGGILNELATLEEQADNRDDEKLSDSVMDLDCVIVGLRDHCVDFLRSRLSWKDLALKIEESVDDLETEFVGISEYHVKVRPLLNTTAQHIILRDRTG